MLVSKQEYNKEITIDKNVIREIKDFFTGKIVIASKDISCNKAHINIQKDKEDNEITSFVSDSETVFLLKGSSIRINKIESYSEYLRFYCECCGEDGKIELVCIDKPLSSKEQSKLIFNKTLSTPISPKYQKMLDDMPSPEQAVSDFFTSNLVLLRKSEEFNNRQALRQKKLKRKRIGWLIAKIAGTFFNLIGGFVIGLSIEHSGTMTEVMGTPLTDGTIKVIDYINEIGCGFFMGFMFGFWYFFIFQIIVWLTDSYVSKKKNIWHKLYKWIYGKDYGDVEGNEDLYDIMNREELYNLENMSINSIEDKKPRLLSVGKIKKEKYKKNLELYRTVDKGEKEVFEFPAFPSAEGVETSGKLKNG